MISFKVNSLQGVEISHCFHPGGGRGGGGCTSFKLERKKAELPPSRQPGYLFPAQIIQQSLT
jgi:hypothetical protein